MYFLRFILLGKYSLLRLAKYWQAIYPSGHTVGLAHFRVLRTFYNLKCITDNIQSEFIVSELVVMLKFVYDVSVNLTFKTWNF